MREQKRGLSALFVIVPLRRIRFLQLRGDALKEAFDHISAIAKKGSDLTLNDLADISPKVTESIDKLIENAAEKSIVLDREEVMGTPLNEFSDLLMTEVKEIEIGALLYSTSSEIFDDPDTGAILKNLFFGNEGVNYELQDGKPVMLPVSYVYESGTFVCVDETVYTKNGDVWTTEDSENYIAEVNGTFGLYSGGDLVYQLRADDETKYTAVIVNANGNVEEVKQTSLQISSFMGENGNFMDVFGKLELGTLLGITTKADVENSDAMLVALAYGTYGVDFTYDGSKIIPVGDNTFPTLGDLMNNPNDLLNNVQLGSLLGITTKADVANSDPMLVALAYGTYGVDFEYDGVSDDSKIIAKEGGKAFTTIAMLMDSDNAGDIFKSIPLSSIFTVEDGDTGLIASLVNKGWTIGDLNETNIQSLTLGEVLPDAIGNGDGDFFAALKHTPLNDLNATYIKEHLTIGQALGITEENKGSYGMLSKFKDTKLGDFNETKLKTELKIGDVINIDAHPLLKALKDYTLSEINKDVIDSLKLSDMLGADVESNFYLKHLKNPTLGTLSTDISNLTVAVLFADSVYDESGNVKGTWKYLLTDANLSDGTTESDEYKVTDMSELMENMKANIQKATLKALVADGLASGITSDTLNTKLVCKILGTDYLGHLKTNVLHDDTLKNNDGDKYIDDKTLGDLTMTQLTAYLSWALGNLAM